MLPCCMAIIAIFLQRISLKNSLRAREDFDVVFGGMEYKFIDLMNVGGKMMYDFWSNLEKKYLSVDQD